MWAMKCGSQCGSQCSGKALTPLNLLCKVLLGFGAHGAVAVGCRALPGMDLVWSFWDLPIFHHPTEGTWSFASSLPTGNPFSTSAIIKLFPPSNPKPSLAPPEPIPSPLLHMEILPPSFTAPGDHGHPP